MNDTNFVFDDYDPSTEIGSLFQDAYNQVFFSMGCCVGVWFAYGSYNHIKKPVIMDVFIIAILDFIFSFVAGFIMWSVIGWLYAKKNFAYSQTSSIGLILIAFPEAAAESGNSGWFGIFCFFIFLASIDSAFSYLEAIVTNICDEFKTNRTLTAAIVCLVGAAISAIFTTNWGWILFDLVDHYISNYIIIGVGFLQCVSVGWLFEYDSTAAYSVDHAKSMKYLSSIYWFSTIVICFYGNFGFPDYTSIGILCITITTMIAMAASKWASNMPFFSWYHEVVMSGVDKLSMSITSLSIPGKPTERKLWMPLFETYFGLAIKYINPACLLWMLCENLANDLDAPYADQPAEMQLFSSVFIFISLLIIFGPMFMCNYPQRFEYNVNLEFNADNLYEAKLRNVRMLQNKKLDAKGIIAIGEQRKSLQMTQQPVEANTFHPPAEEA